LLADAVHLRIEAKAAPYDRSCTGPSPSDPARLVGPGRTPSVGWQEQKVDPREFAFGPDDPTCCGVCRNLVDTRAELPAPRSVNTDTRGSAIERMSAH